MSRKYTFTALAVALGLVAGACSEQADPTSANDAGITSVTTTANARGPIVHRVSMGSSDICVGVGLSPGCDQNLSLVALEMADGTIKGQFIDVFGFGSREPGMILHAPVTCLSVNGNEAWVGGVITGPNFTGLPIVIRVRDNGTSANDPPDQSSILDVLADCTAQPALALLDIRGQVKID